MHIYRNKGFDDINYIDDIGSVEQPARANDGYEALVDLVQGLGFLVDKDKCSSPSTAMVFLGKTFDSDTMSVSIPQSKLDEIRNIIQQLLSRKTITRRKLESVIGKLSYIADCIRSARLFIARLLELLHSVKSKSHHLNLNSEAKKDLVWLLKFMDRFNGRTAILEDDWCSPDEIMASDSTLVGIGGVHQSSSGMQYFHEVIPLEWKDQHICVYELLAILVCLHTWGSQNPNKRILMQCDNFRAFCC